MIFIVYTPIFLYCAILLFIPGCVIFIPIFVASLIILAAIFYFVYEIDEYLDKNRFGRFVSLNIYLLILSIIIVTFVIISS